jgi:uncharacterized protein DUF4760
MEWAQVQCWAEELAKFAPLATASIALTAAIIAMFAIRTQRDIARKRAAFDFIMRITTDDKVIALKRDLSEPVDRLRNAQSWKEDQLREDFGRVVTTVNIFESMAAAINTKIIDEDLCYKVLSPEATHVFDGVDLLVQRLKQSPYSPRAADELRKLIGKWKKRADKEGI